MKKIILLFTFFCCLSLSAFISAQTVYEPIHSSVYGFLDRMAQKGIIIFNDNIKPVSREYIAKKLLELKKNEINLTEVEKSDLDFYIKDFGIEENFLKNSDFKVGNQRETKIISADSLRNLSQQKDENQETTILSYDPYGRLRMFAYEDSLFKINASPILGYEAGSRGGAKYSHRWDGLYLYGYLSNNIGYSFRFQDNSEDGTTIDKNKNFTPVTGVDIAKADVNNIQYSEINVNIAYNWKWGDISIGKDFLNWGYGRSGLLVLSDKAPSFPFIRFDLQPVSWLRFNYIHAWLNSGVIDSTQSYFTALPGQVRTIFRDKFFAQHTLTVTPVKGLDVSVGESIVYSDKLQISYLIPIMFFRLADHYLSQADNNAGGNSQFFLGVSSRNQIKNTHLYGTLFIDEITLEGLFNPQKQRNQLGFTLGGSVTDLPFDNLTLTAEYTKIYPYVYTHYIPTQTYQNNGYVMGDWIGNNADLVFGALDYRFIRGLQATLWAQYIRKGGQGPESGQYTQPQPPFLYGLRTNYSYIGFDLKYEITHELFARLQYQTTKTELQQPNLSFSNSRLNEFYVSLYYGIL